jgi:hypothetical protein
MLKEKSAFIRFVNRDIDSIHAIDRVANEFHISRANAITRIIERLNTVDSSYLNPLTLPPKFVNG